MTNTESDKAPKIQKQTKSKEIGYKKPPVSPGRPKGQANKTTIKMRDFWQQICESKQPQIEESLNFIFETDPAEAVKLVLLACEFFTPKIARIEASGIDGGPIQVENVTLKI